MNDAECGKSGVPDCLPRHTGTARREVIKRLVSKPNAGNEFSVS